MDNIKEVQKGENVIRYAPLSSFANISKFVNGAELQVVEVCRNNSTESFVITKQHLNEFFNDSYSVTDLKTKAYQLDNCPIMLVKDEFLSNLTKYGRITANYLRQFDDKPKYDEKNLVSRNLLKDVSNPHYKFVQFVPNCNHKQIWRDETGTLYMQPFLLDHIDGKLDDNMYHLDEFVEHLSHRDDVAFIANMERFSSKPPKLLYCPLKGDEPDIGGVIVNIEHHLEEGDSRPPEVEQAHLVYYPKQEDIFKVMNWNRDVDGRKPENLKRGMYCVENFILREILGGKEFLIQTPELEEVPKRKFKH